MKKLGLRFALVCAVAVAASGSANALEGTPCTEGQENAYVQTGLYGYKVYQCLGVWTYLYECDESGYCFIGSPS
ncbi:hypothetical protein [Luteimonas sp. gir]|uniref:hypothetical protein n=1 Tax=Luteimonas sp. gir TaxID=3127960 RepID=UPI003075E845